MDNKFIEKAKKFLDEINKFNLLEIRCFVIYGSVANNTQKIESDIDCVIFVDEINTEFVNYVRKLAYSDYYHQTPMMSVNIVTVSNFIDTLMGGDSMNVTIALEGKCLLSSKIFDGIHSIVISKENLPSLSLVNETLKNKIIQFKTRIEKRIFVDLLESTYLSLCSFLFYKKIKKEGLKNWNDLTFKNVDVLLLSSKFLSKKNQKIINNILTLRKSDEFESSNIKISEFIGLLKEIGDKL